MERWARVTVAGPTPAKALDMHRLTRQYVQDASGWRACSSGNHQSSIILRQFRPDYGGTYYYHFDALGSVVALTDADGNWGQLLTRDKRQVSRVDPRRYIHVGPKRIHVAVPPEFVP